MKDIWEDHHRRMAEIDRRHKIRMRVLTTAAVLLFIALGFVIYKY